MRLRWHLSKIWQTPFHDSFFDTITPVQWLFYAHMVGEDRREEAEAWRDRLEYMARFIDNESVEKIKKAREHHERSIEDGVQVDGFDNLLISTFGKGLGSALTDPSMRQGDADDDDDDPDVDLITVHKG